MTEAPQMMTLAQRVRAWRKACARSRREVRLLIRHEMLGRDYTGKKLAEELGCSENNVSKTLLGYQHSTGVLDKLRAIGVPEHLLFDPRFGGPGASVNSEEHGGAQ